MLKTIYLLILTMTLTTSLAFSACTSRGVKTTTSSETASELAGGRRPAGFTEYPIGDEVQLEGMNIAAVYFQAVQMEPREKSGLGINEADIHLEADIHALKDNKVGFGFGEFIPNLTVKYRLKNLDSGQEQEGSLMPMNASDGPHYGANIKMARAGKYKLSFIIESPENQGFLLHVDRETGVPGRFWRKAIEVSWDFNYLPRKF